MNLFIKNCRIRNFSAHRAEIQVPYDGKKPTPPVVPFEPLKGPEGAQQCLLHQVFGIFIVPNIPSRQIKSRLQMPKDQPLEIFKFLLMVHERALSF